MKALMPLAIALAGLAAGVGAGLALRPQPVTETTCAEPAAAGRAMPEAAHAEAPAIEPAAEAGAAPCPPAEPDPFAPAPHAEKKPAAELAYVPMDKPFVVPVFAGEKVVAMVVVSLSVETGIETVPSVEAVKPRLRDSILKVMFRHANSGGFDGSFTTGRKMDDLKSALLNPLAKWLPRLPSKRS